MPGVEPGGRRLLLRRGFVAEDLAPVVDDVPDLMQVAQGEPDAPPDLEDPPGLELAVELFHHVPPIVCNLSARGYEQTDIFIY